MDVISRVAIILLIFTNQFKYVSFYWNGLIKDVYEPLSAYFYKNYIFSIFLSSAFAQTQIYDAEKQGPSKAYYINSTVKNGCNQATINALTEWYSGQSCTPFGEWGPYKYAHYNLEPEYCSVSACVRCMSGDIYIGESKCFDPRYYAAIPIDSPPPQTCAGNPIEISSGAKIQKEIDINPRGVGHVGFERTYNNTVNEFYWYNAYQRVLRKLNPESNQYIRERGGAYFDRHNACMGGWTYLKTKVTDSWAKNATASYVNGVCEVKKNNIVVRKIPILRNGINVPSINVGAVQLLREDGATYVFNLTAENSYKETTGGHGQLSTINNASPIAWRYKTSNGDIEDYSVDGKLLSITASNGMKQELFYDATSDLLTRVKDSTNREITFAYTGNHIGSITVDGNKTTFYTYNNHGLINKVIRPDNTERIYHYEDTRFPTFLTGITDERGRRYATWAYDVQGRAISSEHAGGVDKTLLSFNADGSTTVTNPLGKKTVYRFDDIAGARRVVKVEGQPTANCAGANQNYTYTTEGWVESKTDWKGVKTTYQYNTSGQEVSRTEAFGTTDARIITTEWHPTFYVKTKVTEPGKETAFSYDANGRLFNKVTRSLSE